MNNVTLIGIDTAKSIFHLHAVDHRGKKVYQRVLRRPKLLTFIAQQAACTIAIEACSGSHHWARQFKACGHKVLIINARRVKKFASTRNKNDFNDARAITKAARDEDTYFVAHKTVVQQEIQAVHVMREATITQRTAEINRTRALLVEFGIILPKSRAKFMERIPEILEDGSNSLTGVVRELVDEALQFIRLLTQKVTQYDKRLQGYLKSSPVAKRLTQIPGIGRINSTALAYMIADPKIYKNGRHCAAALGLTPKEHSTGGKQRLGRISREGNVYLRKNLIQGAQAFLRHAGKRTDPFACWAHQLQQRKGKNLAAVAVANRIVRIAWAMLVQGSDYNYKQGLQGV